jgi:hypothetical protein
MNLFLKGFSMTRRKTLAAALVCTAIVTSLVVYARFSNQGANPWSGMPAEETVDYHSAEAYWKDWLHKNGPAKSAKKLVEIGANLTLNQAHLLAHALGETLFKTEGLSGLSYCPSDFAYGCAHQFVGITLSQYGISSLKEIYAGCVEQVGEGSTGCGHAIGHGITGFFGYSIDDLDKSMRACDLLESKGPYSKCLSGVFFEHNFRELGLSDAAPSTVRPVTIEGRFKPCDSLPEGYAQACFRALPLWWSSVSRPDGFPAWYAQTGTRCRELKHVSQGSYEACFMGIGFVAASDANLDPASADAYCTEASESARERMLCIADAVYRFKISGVEDTAEVCAALNPSEDSVQYCLWRAAL